MIAWHIQNLNTQARHSLKNPVDRQQILHATLIILLMTPPRTTKVADQQHPI
jgi:hypothetical protein